MESNYDSLPSGIKESFKKYFGIIDRMQNENYAMLYKKNENDCKKHNTIKSRIPIFKQPVLTKQFVDRLKINFVSLETVGVCEKTLIGFVQTIPIPPFDQNKVTIRASWDNWVSYKDIEARKISHASPHESLYVKQFSNPSFQNYDFSLEFDANNDSMIFFAIRYTNGVKEYWDNNNFHNYCIY
uniref:Protein phosphatase 1 regulatory subunit 3D (Trinotate prediction) n=1 Tax=Myxobolus squamalis TaxID=59785 RepID=A0A6B2GAM1_MYXSQ